MKDLQEEEFKYKCIGNVVVPEDTIYQLKWKISRNKFYKILNKSEDKENTDVPAKVVSIEKISRKKFSNESEDYGLSFLLIILWHHGPYT